MRRVFCIINRFFLGFLPLSCALALPVETVDEMRMIHFSGYDWTVRYSEGREGPGPNRFSADERSVRVDNEGFLHLGIWNRGRSWYAAEVRLPDALGYGTYVFETQGPVRFLSPNVILGLFTFDHDAPEQAYREIDIELGRFGNPSKPDAQFVVHPFPPVENRHEFNLPDNPPAVMTHAFRWSSGTVEFRSVMGSHHDPFALSSGSSLIMGQWTMQGTQVPDPGNARVHMNLWLYQGRSPDEATSAVIRAFRFLR